MKKLVKSLLISLAAVATLGMGTAVTLAASYVAPAENTVYSFGAMSGNFQDLSYYFASGAGSEADPFIIKNSQQLRNLSKLQNSGAMPDSKWFQLGTSFQYEGDALEPIGTSTNPFTGVFSGEDHSITFLNVSTSTYTNVGMFGYVGTTSLTGTVRNLILVGPSVSYTGSSNCNIGIVAGYKTTSGQTSVVQCIGIYGGVAPRANDIDAIRAKIVVSGGTPTCGNGIVGVGGSVTTSGTAAGFISTLTNATAYTSASTYTGVTASGTYKLYHNGSAVTRIV